MKEGVGSHKLSKPRNSPIRNDFHSWSCRQRRMVRTVGGLTKSGLYFGWKRFPAAEVFIPYLQLGESVNDKALAAHLKIDRYGDFRLTAAIRPSPALSVVPRQGYRIETYRDAKNGMQVPVLAAAVSCEGLFEAFLSLLDPLGPVVDVVLETSHEEKTRCASYCRSRIDLPVLASYFCDFEELLLNDGCTGVAVIGTSGPMEVQFDEHKLLIIYAHDLKPFERIVRQMGIIRDDRLKLITEGEHIHSTDSQYAAAFEQLCYRLGIGETAEHVSW